MALLPAFASSNSIDIFLEMKKSPALGNQDREDFIIQLEQEINASSNRELFEASTDSPVRVYKGASFDIWAPFHGQPYAEISRPKAEAFLQAKRLNSHRLNGTHGIFDTSQVADTKTLPFKSPRIAFRDIARATDKRTLISALLPPETICVHNAPVVHIAPSQLKNTIYLVGIFSSIIADWYIRLFVEAHVQFYILYSLPVPFYDDKSELGVRATILSAELSFQDSVFDQWANEIGFECRTVDYGDKQDKIHELDAVVAHLYGLSEPQLVHIFETFHEGWHYEARLNEVLKHYHAWADKA